MKTSNVLQALAALAQETRLAFYRLLVEHAPKGLPAGQIAERLGIPPPSLSFHLKELWRAGLVVPQPSQPFRMVSRRPRRDERARRLSHRELLS